MGRPIVFTHIPKAAGSALNQALRDALQPCRPLAGFDHAIFGGFTAFDGIGADQRRTIHARPEELPADADFIGGHFAHHTTRTAFPTAAHLIVLREPIARVLSQWTYWRAQDDASLVPWGSWAARVRTARQPLSAFLADPLAACQTDNLAMRMLLWPHPLLPGDGFITPAHDARLLAEATARLDRYDHADIVENPDLADRLGSWLGRDLSLCRVNETRPMPPGCHAILHREMTTAALDLLERRSRLDAVLWHRVAGATTAPDAADALRRRTLLRTAARHARLLAADG